jgi:hypothetical protein
MISATSPNLLQETEGETLSAMRNVSLSTRYSDAYARANAQTRMGASIKTASFVVGGLVVAVGVVGALASGEFGAVVLGILGGALVGVIGYGLGSMIVANGQILKATLDTAVNTSPMLNNDDRAGIMSL